MATAFFPRAMMNCSPRSTAVRYRDKCVFASCVVMVVILEGLARLIKLVNLTHFANERRNSAKMRHLCWLDVPLIVLALYHSPRSPTQNGFNQLPVPGGPLQSLCFRFIARYSGLSSSERSSSSSAFLARTATIPRSQAAATEAKTKSYPLEALPAGVAIGAGVEIAMQMATGMAHEPVDDGTLLV